MTIIQELELIRKGSPDKLLHAKDVVNFARSPETALHAKFEWDDSAAAENYRQWQAREIIRVSVRLLDIGDGHKVPIRAFVSFANEKGGDDGYLPTRVVLANEDKRRALIGAILKRVSSILDLHPLPELEPVRQAIAFTRAQQGIEQIEASPPVRRLVSK